MRQTFAATKLFAASCLMMLLVFTGCDTVESPGDSEEENVFYGPAVPIGEGTGTAWVELDDSGAPIAVGVDLSEKALQAQSHATMNYVLRFGDEEDLTPFDHILLNYNPHGHEPPGIYDLEHFDIHFYMTSVGAREAIGADEPGFAVEPGAEYIPDDYTLLPGGVPQMGAHWGDTLAPELNGETFTYTFIWGSFDGAVTFLEPMITTAYLLSNPDETVPVRQPDAYQQDGYYPHSYTMQRLDDPVRYRVALTDLSFHAGE